MNTGEGGVKRPDRDAIPPLPSDTFMAYKATSLRIFRHILLHVRTDRPASSPSSKFETNKLTKASAEQMRVEQQSQEHKYKNG